MESRTKVTEPGTDLTAGPGTVRTGDTESDTETTVRTQGGRERGRGTESGTGVRGRETVRGITIGSAAGAGIERSTGNTMKTETDIETETEIEEKMRGRESRDHLRPELRRSPEEKRHETRKEDRIVWGNLHRRNS